MWLVLAFLLPFPSVVYSACYSHLSSEVLICDGQHNTNSTQSIDYDYINLLNKQEYEQLHIRNYIFPIFIINQYSSKLNLLNVSNNQIRTILIISNVRFESNLRRLILESNHLRQFNSDTILLPSSLELISLANNELEILDARVFSKLRNLTDLDLRNNRLKRILPALLLHINVHLDNNPLDCQCTPEFYRGTCENSTNLKQSLIEDSECVAPHYDSKKDEVYPTFYLRFSKFVLVCPISAYPPPIIIWSTPFGLLSTTKPSMIDLVLSINQSIVHNKLTGSGGPPTTRTKHVLHAFQSDRLSVTRARASLQQQFYCSGINMLGTYKHKFNFHVQTNAQSYAVKHMVYTCIFAVFMISIAILLCVIFKMTVFYKADHMKTPPIFPTMTPNSAARTPPNFEFNQWISSAAANITGTLEQVCIRLRSGVYQVGGSIRNAAGASVSKFNWFHEATRQRLSFIRAHTLSSLRNPSHMMRSGLHRLTAHVATIRDYCGVTTGQLVAKEFLLQEQQFHRLQYSPSTMRCVYNQRLPAVMENDEQSVAESVAMKNHRTISPYAGLISSGVLADGIIVGRLDEHVNTALAVLNNSDEDRIETSIEQNLIMGGFLIGGVGTFHNESTASSGEQSDESENLINYGEHRPIG